MTTDSIQNLKGGYDPFADTGEDEVGNNKVQEGLIHIRIQQRNGRKTLTTVQGINPKYDLKRIVKACKREFACNGTVVDHAEYGECIQLQGDQRDQIKKFIADVGLARPELIKVHGF
ncbi:eukaryotic translation initiation factor 1-like [Patella vulgata]|uniref:SUI1 domain-containing protein n=1 Tax=Patella caerulea TaxID=87958 RepID=A0AAN8GHU3_PATCE|nr:eukaryotic translation initiation factor 1-like [Patella vulgata]